MSLTACYCQAHESLHRLDHPDLRHSPLSGEVLVSAYYNEHDPFAAEWLRNLIAAGHIAPGDVDERSIEDVRPNELAGYTQCHFFAGIGGWSCALRLAGWPDDRPVWTGSCPCQPFSAAGKGAGTADERHLWPAWQWLIRQCRPSVIFGEQVEAAINHGWLDLVQDDLEGESYAVWPVGLPAACVGAPHIRQRLWFVAERLGDADNKRLQGYRQPREQSISKKRQGKKGHSSEDCTSDRMADTRISTEQQSESRSTMRGFQEGVSEDVAIRPISSDGFWRAADWLCCRDGKWRPVEPGTFPLAHGVSARVGRLRGYGNAIVPQVAQAFIEAYLAA